MLFSTQIPEKLLESPSAANFVKVLDELQAFKDFTINKANRFYNPVLLTDLKFLRYLVNDYGYPTVPADFPKEILDNMVLNVENVFKLKGSKMGLDYLLRVLTCGLPIIDDSQFYPKSAYIIPDDYAEAGYIFSPQDYPFKTLYLFNGGDYFALRQLVIGISTPYYYLESLKKYIQDNILKFIGFVDANTTVTITFTQGPYVPNPYANQYFVNP